MNEPIRCSAVKREVQESMEYKLMNGQSRNSAKAYRCLQRYYSWAETEKKAQI